MGKILDLAEDLWTGRKDTFSYHPFGVPRGLELISELNSQRTWFYRGFSNSIIRETEEGLIIIDPGANFDVDKKFKAIREVTNQKVHTIIFTHGHVDHVGIKPFLEEIENKHLPSFRVIAHEAIINRFDRYKLTESWNAYINLRQFRGDKGKPAFKKEFYYPDKTYQDELKLEVGRVNINLKHSKGETDDHTWVFFPDTELICTGDLFIWGVPNAGNPQKVQRYASNWASALREMERLNPKILCPGHGVPIIGKERVKEALSNTALLLESLHSQTISLMNKGAPLDFIIHNIEVSDELLEKPYLRPIYDEPEFIVRNIWRLYGGWYDGTPSHLKPAPEIAIANEIVNLAGGVDNITKRAKELLDDGELRLASHLAEWAWLNSPENKNVSEIAAKIFTARAKKETSTMAIGIYLSAARKMGGDPDKEMPGRTVIQAQDSRNRQM
ncbi:MAG: alkyl sulfatase dimerization domain-containing protein [Promethearchaeota archaeon]